MHGLQIQQDLAFTSERCPVAARLPDAWSVVNPVFYDVGYFLLQQVALVFWFLNGGIKCTLITIFCMDLCNKMLLINQRTCRFGSKQQKHSMKRSISRAGFRTGQAEQMPRGLHICLVTSFFFEFYGRVGLHSSTTVGCPGASICLNPNLSISW